ncbi:LAMI_0F14334g1_1 [Lachancea mirantina]|uniref:LAMI_0F14334g1_1 n=1 Tax=Lachancea mirantina TaxID=1230905 RepID=A0A1G4K3T1_9SACH|nr:LAMI_0F14334g1_1 [Lachancea mirantina]
MSQQPHISKGSYVQKSFLNLKGLGHDLAGSVSSRTSLSQLKLNQLTVGKNWGFLEDYGLEELRDGFFDPIYTKHERVQADGDDDEPKSAWKIDISEVVKTELNLIRDNWKQIAKYFIAFFASICICLVRPAGSWMGHSHRQFLPIAVLLHHPVRSIGVQLEVSIFAILGNVLALGWSSLAWYISTATGPAASHQGGVFFASMFIAVFLAAWLRTAYMRFFYFSQSFGMGIIYLHTASLAFSKRSLHWQLFWDFGISNVFGIALSLLVCATIFPSFGNSEVIIMLTETLDSMKQFLVTFVDAEYCHDLQKLHSLQRHLVATFDVTLSQGVREFANQITLSRMDHIRLKELRNSLTIAASTLKILPVAHKLISNLELEEFYHKCENHSSSGTGTDASSPPSLHQTPTKTENPSSDHDLSVLRSTFSDTILMLLVEMISTLETMSTTLAKLSNAEDRKTNLQKICQNHDKLKLRIAQLDMGYRKFTKTHYFNKELLSASFSVDIFLFLRYIRQTAKNLIISAHNVSDIAANAHWKLNLPHYPLRRALVRLPAQCNLDQGATTIFEYFEAKSDVDDIFECLYNSYTSTHSHLRPTISKNQMNATIRAIDHKDFSLHTTQNTLRFKLWLLSRKVVSDESKWAFKIIFILTFMALPSWLPESLHWYETYQCWWCPVLYFLLINRRNTGNWDTVLKRSLCCLLGVFWGWCANQARHFSSPYVIGCFAGLIGFLISCFFFSHKSPKLAFITLMSFSVIALEPYSANALSLGTAVIWKDTWVTGLALFFGVTLSLPTNWIVWPFMARYELAPSISSLLGHISQSYQSITDRYLYRDANDDPTGLTLKFSTIREVRLSQSLTALRELLQSAENEPIYISNFKPLLYTQLMEACDYLLERMIAARISGRYFEVWDRDRDSETTRALLSLRRDSAASVIFVLYMLSNCFRSKNKVPKYLPNPIMARKKLFDFISKFEMSGGAKVWSAGGKTLTSETDACPERSKEPGADYEKEHWTEVHAMAFSRAYTDIAHALQKVVELSKEILGEEL